MHSRVRKNQRLTMVAGGLLIALVALIAGIQINDKRKAHDTLPKPADVQRITIQRAGFDDITLALNEQQWVIEQPCELLVNPQRLQPLLDALAPVTHGYDAREVDLDAAGLTQPEALIQINNTRIAIGTTDLGGERRYILRNDRVEFVPEWILSLINGGLSALAMTDLFDQPISELSVDTTGQNRTLSTEELAPWQALQAQQIIAWPLPNQQLPLASFNQRVRSGSATQNFSLYHFPRFSAMHFDNAGCAFILATDALPATAPR